MPPVSHDMSCHAQSDDGCLWLAGNYTEAHKLSLYYEIYKATNENEWNIKMKLKSGNETDKFDFLFDLSKSDKSCLLNWTLPVKT